jgi:hypothetical protein
MSGEAEHLPAELDDRDHTLFAMLTNAQRLIVDRRLWIIRQMEAALIVGRATGQRESDTLKSFVVQVAAVSPPLIGVRTLYHWRRAFRQEGIAGLFDLRWGVFSDVETRRRICGCAQRLTGTKLRDLLRVAVYLLNLQAARTGEKLSQITGCVSVGLTGDRTPE